MCCLQEIHLKTRDTYRLKVKGWTKLFHAKGDQKKAGVVILISDKVDFKTKSVKRDKEGHYIMIKGYNNYKYICTQHRSTTIYKTHANKCEKGKLRITK